MLKLKIILIVILICLSGVNSFAWFWEKDYLVNVNGEIIDIEDYEKRLMEFHRQISMRRNESKASGIDFRLALKEMIDDYLLYQEGMRLGMDKDPDYARKSKAYLEFQSIIRLRKEEVKDRVEVKEDEVRDYYEKNILKPAGEDQEPPAYDVLKNKIKNIIYKKKEKEREEQYLKELKNNAEIIIHENVLSSLSKKDVGGDTVVARVNSNTISASELQKEYGKAVVGKNSEETLEIIKKALEGLIGYILIKEDALNHNYPARDPDFGKMILQYNVSLMSAIVKKKIISPGVKITEKDCKDYYEKNKDEYREATRYKLGVIKVKDKEEAAALYRELKAGSDFNRLARLKSLKLKGKKDNSDWWSERELSPQVKDALSKMKEGELSDVIDEYHFFKILKLIDIQQGKIMGYSKVKKMIMSHLSRKRYELLLAEYLSILRENSSIDINEDRLEEFEENFKAKVSDGR